MKRLMMFSFFLVACGQPSASLFGHNATVPRGSSEGSLIRAFGKPCTAQTVVLSDSSSYDAITYDGQIEGADSFLLMWPCGATPCDVTFYFGKDNTWDFVTSTCPPIVK